MSGDVNNGALGEVAEVDSQKNVKLKLRLADGTDTRVTSPMIETFHCRLLDENMREINVDDEHPIIRGSIVHVHAGDENVGDTGEVVYGPDARNQIRLK